MSGYAHVVVLHASLIHRERAFTYAVPDGVEAPVGALVRVPFAGARTTGVVVETLTEPDVERTAPIIRTLGPGLDADTVSLALWVADRYLSTPGEALAAALPERVAGVERRVRAPAPAHTAEPPKDLLAGWRGGDTLLRAIRRGEQRTVSFRAPPSGSRGALIAGLAATALAAGRGVLVLVPEVRVQGEVAALLDATFGNAVAWLGTDREPAARYAAWLALRAGEKRIACGGRAGVFAPVPDLGLVIVDDESHVSYKERRAPRFHARTVAAERARRCGAVLVAVGVPPSIELAAAAASGKVGVVAPPRAATRVPVSVLDRSKESERHVPAGRTVAAVKRTLAGGGRVAILTHKGGDDARAIFERTVRAVQPKRPALLDARATAATLRRGLAGADLLVATPVIAKDLTFDALGLLAIVHADAALAQTDFRTAEETFSTWWRTARFARHVVLETADPAHDAVAALVRFDPDALAAKEIERRRALGYPPFGGLAKIVCGGEDAAERAAAVAGSIAGAGGEVLGPLERDDGARVLLVRAANRAAVETVLRPLVAAWRAESAPIRIDLDPRDVLA